MLVTIPVTMSTIPRTQKRPAHEVKSTCQGGRRATCQMTVTTSGPASLALPGSPSTASCGQGSGHNLPRTDRQQMCGCRYEQKGTQSPRKTPGIQGSGPSQACSHANPPRPHLSLKAEDGDRDGHHGSDDRSDDDGSGFVHTGRREEFRETRDISNIKVTSNSLPPKAAHPESTSESTGSPGTPSTHDTLPENTLPENVTNCP